jgi:hypothetical protein
MLPHTTQFKKACWYQYRKRLSQIDRDNYLTFNTHMYIGKIRKCPICKQKGYLKLSGTNFQVQHQIKKITISKGHYKAIYKYCSLPTIRNIIRDFDRKVARQFNEHNPNTKKSLYDKKRYETQKRGTSKTAYYHPIKNVEHPS